MLTVAKVTQSQSAGYADYLDGRSVPSSLGDYYLKDGDRVEAPGRWAGGALAMGADADRPVSGDELRALMTVRRPDNGLPLRHAGAGGETVAAIDATFSAPKSVSAVWALAEAEMRGEIERAHETAVDRALRYATGVVAMVRERIDRETVVHARAREVVATSWRHTTARTVDGRPPDPQLHSHVLLHAAIRRDGQVVAIDSRSWLVHRREVGAAYRTELAVELAQLGFQIERGTGRGGRYFELGGVPRELLDAWSSRHWQVQEAIQARLRNKRAGPDGRAPVLTPAEDRHLTTSTRAPKDAPATSGDLDRHWSRAATRLGFDRRAVQALSQHRRLLVEVASAGEVVTRLTEFDATFAQPEARAVALEASTGTSIPQALERLQELRAAGELLALRQGRTTTRAQRAAERRTLAVAQRLAAARVDPVPTRIVERRTEELDRKLQDEGASLSAEQRAAIALACSERQLVVIEGYAGSGKSTTLQAVARAQRDTGREIVVTSTAALAAQRLAEELRQAGVETRSYSTVALDAAQHAGNLALDTFATVVWDEAALASTCEQERLLEAVEVSGARAILLGDPRQSHAVAPGGLWPKLALATAKQGAWIELEHNVRARDPRDRAAQRHFREGHHNRALESYAQRDRIHITAEQRQAEDAALDAAALDRQSGHRTLVIAQTSNEHLDELNARAQAIRAQSGELGKKGIPVAGKPNQLHRGDDVQIRHTIHHPQHGRLSNGTTADVVAIDPGRERVVLGLADGREVALERNQLERADVRLWTALGFAETGFVGFFFPFQRFGSHPSERVDQPLVLFLS